MITHQLPIRKSKWSAKFLSNKEKSLEAGAQRRLCLEKERCYVPEFVHSNSVTCFVDRERELESVPFVANIHGPRNTLCAVCNIKVTKPSEEVHCDLCPVIVHSACRTGNDCCLQTCQAHFTIGYKKHVLEMIKGDGIWCCDFCSKEIVVSIEEERLRLLNDRYKRLEFFAAMRLQASCMRHKAQKRYKILQNGILRLQARCRGFQIRKSFMMELATTQRSFKIKNCEFDLDVPMYDAKSTLSCIIHVINDEKSDLEDLERQLYRFDTHGISQHSDRGRFNDSFLVYSCNAMVKLAFTMHAKEHETSSSRSIFLGQYAVDARKILTRSFFSGRPCRLKGELTSIEVEPKDQRFSFLPSKNCYGEISFEIHPISNIESKCGVIEEIISGVLKGARRKWFAEPMFPGLTIRVRSSSWTIIIKPGYSRAKACSNCIRGTIR
eukprot:scaffold11_cov248-Chaetoceros_neogracile.AAC.18